MQIILEDEGMHSPMHTILDDIVNPFEFLADMEEQ